MAGEGGVTITIEDLLAEATAREVSVKVLLRQDLLERHATLEAELQQAMSDDQRENRDPVGPGLARDLSAFEDEIEAAKREFRFRSLGRRKWADLIAKHPPTKEQQKISARIDHNPETFPAVAIAASCVSPVLTVEQVQQLEDRMNVTQFNELWQGCLDANVGGGSGFPKSLLAGSLLRTSAALERSLASTGSPEASSSDE